MREVDKQPWRPFQGGRTTAGASEEERKRRH